MPSASEKKKTEKFCIFLHSIFFKYLFALLILVHFYYLFFFLYFSHVRPLMSKLLTSLRREKSDVKIIKSLCLLRYSARYVLRFVDNKSPLRSYSYLIIKYKHFILFVNTCGRSHTLYAFT